MNKKTGRPEEQPENRQETESAHYILPARLDSVIAETLARLFRKETLTQQDATRELSTTRLGSVIHVLRHSYCWGVIKENETGPTKDGRMATYGRYHLPQSEIDRVPADKRAAWIEAVFKARARRRLA